MKFNLSSFLPQFKGSKNNLLIYGGIAVTVTVAAWLIWYENRKNKGLIPPDGKGEDQPSSRLKYVYGAVYEKQTQTQDFKPEKFPAFQLNKGEYFIWDGLVLNQVMSNTLLSRGVTHINVKKVDYTIQQGKRFLILYRNFFAQPMNYSNLSENKARLQREVNSYNPGGVDVLNLDLENDEHTSEYATVCRELAAYARAELGVKYVDYLGMTIANSDYNVTGSNVGRTYFAPYFSGVTNMDDPYPYIQISWFENGDWLYSAAHVTEQTRAVDPSIPQVSFWWKMDVTGQMYIPEHIAHAVPLFLLLTGAKGLINWDVAGRNQYFNVDEALISGFYRASLVNDIRQGKPEFLVPEISLDGGKSWTSNEALAAKKNRHPLVRVVKNGGKYVVVGHNPVLNAKPLDVTFRVHVFQDTIRLKDRQTYLGRG
ncbi:hypothetical protein [Siphonobacter sp.]|uniref:hypothetical protein n=1 Tax=Siphonobacter sp. TaxID=1869184 RepID=UPI003B3AED25